MHFLATGSCPAELIFRDQSMVTSIGTERKISLNHYLTNIQKIIFILSFFSALNEKVTLILEK
jgi:hypothetical protein